MVWKLPDEFFRRRPDPVEAEEGADAPVDAGAPSPSASPAAPPASSETAWASEPGPLVEPSGMSLPLRLAILVVVLALVGGFILGRQLMAGPTAPMPTVVPTMGGARPSLPRATESGPQRIHDGPTQLVTPVAVASNCPDSQAGALIDGQLGSAWRCPGDGVGRHIDFTFDGPVELVAIRLASGNPAHRDRTAAERQLVTVRWTFPDGAWFEQGLSGANGAMQEVAFPELTTRSVRLELIATTEPADPAAEGADGISIALVEFLTIG